MLTLSPIMQSLSQSRHPHTAVGFFSILSLGKDCKGISGHGLIFGGKLVLGCPSSPLSCTCTLLNPVVSTFATNVISIGLVVELLVFLTFWILGRRRWGLKGVKHYRFGGHLGFG